MTHQDRRVRVYTIQEYEVLGAFTAFFKRPEYLELPVALDIPVDAEYTSAFHDHYSKSICFVVRHPSFDEVPNGEYIPRFTSGVDSKRVVLLRASDKADEPVYVMQEES
jgi:hypothetical protein